MGAPLKSSGLAERIISFLDWCWPFPVGIVATGLAFLLAAGTWLAIRTPQRPLPERSLGGASSNGIPAQSTSEVPSLTQDSAVAVPSPTTDRKPPIKPTTAEEPSPAPALTKPPVDRPKAELRPVAPRLSAAQKAEIADRLTIGQFLMDRKDYPGAIREFQAALEIDPSSREAKAAIQQAREANKPSESIRP